MNLKITLAASAFVVAAAIGAGVAGAAASGTWKPASDWNGLSPGSFKAQCEAGGGEATFEAGEKPMWSCSRKDSGTVYCDQGSDTKSTNCRRYTPSKYIPVGRTGPAQTDPGGVFQP